MRHALYFTPDPSSPLLAAAEAWLGRSAFPGRSIDHSRTRPPIEPQDGNELVRSAAKYGFHATLKAPFTLAPGRTQDDLLRAVADWSSRHASVGPVALRLAQIDGFFALVPAAQSPRLDAFAAAVVQDFEGFRAPMTEAERARRQPERLSCNERDNLDRWGYPYVMDAFQFHMTLTGRVAPERSEAVRQALMPRFAQLLDEPIAVDTLAVFTEPFPGAPFAVAAHCRLSGERDVAFA